jgi:hypothetical protein
MGTVAFPDAFDVLIAGKIRPRVCLLTPRLVEAYEDADRIDASRPTSAATPLPLEE